MPPKKTRILEKRRIPGQGFRLILEYTKTFPQPVYIAVLESTSDASRTVIVPKCKECEAPLTKVEKTGEIVCTQCGLVQEEWSIQGNREIKLPSKGTKFNVRMESTKEVVVKFDASIPELPYSLYESYTSYRSFKRSRVLLLLSALESVGIKSYPTVAIAEIVGMAWTTASTRLFEMVNYQEVLEVSERGTGGLLRVDDPLSRTGIDPEWTAPLTSNYYSLTFKGRREVKLLIKSTLSSEQLEIYNKFGAAQNEKGKILILLAIAETSVSLPDMREIIGHRAGRVEEGISILQSENLIESDIVIDYTEPAYAYYRLTPDGVEEAEKLLVNSLFAFADKPNLTIGLPIRMLEPGTIEPRSRETGFVMKPTVPDILTEDEVIWYLERQWRQTPEVVRKLREQYNRSQTGGEFKNEWWKSIFQEWPTMSLEQQTAARGMMVLPQTVWVHVIEDVKKFSDGVRSYGPYKEGKLVLVPITVADALIKRGNAITITDLKKRIQRYNVIDKSGKVLNTEPLKIEDAEEYVRGLVSGKKADLAALEYEIVAV